MTNTFNPAVYIVTNKNNTTLYIGVTSDLQKRIFEHKTKPIDSFTKSYNCNKLVYFEIFDDMNEARKREKRLKNYLREWKIELIEANNPEWNDLYDGLC